ncbi:kinase-like domain-containing protein [Phyllosticta capitalensis]|uniref:Kinase-like domain-containing protein n=1 Tax=Phyllosticta capitalensis TaxID=121624 RepID=A0ABR1Z4A8_9PEZI
MMSSTTASIPSIAQIRASTHILSVPDALAKVVKVGDDMAVKYGRSVSLLEAQNLEYVAQNSSVPVPKVLAAFAEQGTGVNFIVMELAPGEPLRDVIESLNADEKRGIEDKIRAALDALRSMEPPGYVGSVGRQACADGVFYVPGHDPAFSGPFENEAAMNEGMLRRMAEYEHASYLSLLRTLMARTLKDHRIVFTHGDLQPKNIMVHCTGRTEQGNRTFDVKLIDWEISGWYPDYWEFCNATVARGFRPEWMEMVQRILSVPTDEYLMMQVVRGILFY